MTGIKGCNVSDSCVCACMRAWHKSKKRILGRSLFPFSSNRIVFPAPVVFASSSHRIPNIFHPFFFFFFWKNSRVFLEGLSYQNKERHDGSHTYRSRRGSHAHPERGSADGGLNKDKKWTCHIIILFWRRIWEHWRMDIKLVLCMRKAAAVTRVMFLAIAC